MRKRLLSLCLAFCLVTAALMGTGFPSWAAGNVQLQRLTQEQNMMALIYLADQVAVYQDPSVESACVDQLPSGQTVWIQDASYSEKEDCLWIGVRYQKGEAEYFGYVKRGYLACSDERFLNWEQKNLPAHLLEDTHILLGDGVPADVAQFPASYQDKLLELKKAHPQWVFVPMNTGLDWNTVITSELAGGRSLVHKSFPDYTKDGAYDDGNWFYATRGILEYYMDPRNMMTDARIFQFELLTYNKTYHTEAAVEAFLNNTFMNSSKKAPGTVMTFAHIFYAIGKEAGREVSPFHLAARVYQEQGKGTSALISGNYPGYEGYYNYFNIKASGTTTTQVIENGLKYAKEKNWNNAYASILGGADAITANYIKKGQDTLYLEKFNVNPNGSYALYSHQYMQNISAPTTEGSSIKKLYESADALNNSFVFKIPVFKNMPEGACPYPSEKNKVKVKLPSGYNTKLWIDGVPYASTSADGKRVVQLEDDTATTAIAYKYNSQGIPNGMYVWTLSGKDGVYTVTAHPEWENLLTYHGFSMRTSGSAGMRVKTGISKTLKADLAKGGSDGYTLQEYGTLVAKQADISKDTLLKDGAGVRASMSYGRTTQGEPIDLTVETIAGRERFAGELDGIPVSNYGTVYSFRGYLILNKQGKETVLYGPVMSKSMSGLANQILQSGVYQNDAEKAQYLNDIVKGGK